MTPSKPPASLHLWLSPPSVATIETAWVAQRKAEIDAELLATWDPVGGMGLASPNATLRMIDADLSDEWNLPSSTVSGGTDSATHYYGGEPHPADRFRPAEAVVAIDPDDLVIEGVRIFGV